MFGKPGVSRCGRRSLLLLLLLFSMVRVNGQGEFVLSGECGKRMGKVVTLKIYDGDSTARVLYGKVKGGEFTIKGTLKRTAPAVLRFGNGQELELVMEAGELTVAVDGESVARSKVNGSRSNSRYRYAMQQIGEGKSVGEFVGENADWEITPYVVYRSMGTLTAEEVEELMGKIDSGARSCYHYWAIGKKLEEMAAVTEGSVMPDFEYMTDKKKKVHYRDSVWEGCPTVLLVGATWCGKCKEVESEARKQCGEEARLVVVEMDRDPKGWDADFMKVLGVEKLPYLMVVDREGKIYARDVRVWELGRLLSAERREKEK